MSTGNSSAQICCFQARQDTLRGSFFDQNFTTDRDEVTLVKKMSLFSLELGVAMKQTRQARCRVPSSFDCITCLCLQRRCWIAFAISLRTHSLCEVFEHTSNWINMFRVEVWGWRCSLQSTKMAMGCWQGPGFFFVLLWGDCVMPQIRKPTGRDHNKS